MDFVGGVFINVVLENVGFDMGLMLVLYGLCDGSFEGCLCCYEDFNLG